MSIINCKKRKRNSKFLMHAISNNNSSNLLINNNNNIIENESIKLKKQKTRDKSRTSIIWMYCKIDVEYFKSNVVMITFNKDIKKDVIINSIKELWKILENVETISQDYKNSFISNQIRSSKEGSTEITLSLSMLQKLRLCGLTMYYKILPIRRAQNIQKKTITLHPLLLRLYCTIPIRNFNNCSSSSNQKKIDEFDGNQLYNFSMIVCNWCNHIDRFTNLETIENNILKPWEKQFKYYNCFHRLINKIYHIEKGCKNEVELFIKNFDKLNLAKCFGIFFLMKQIKLINIEVIKKLQNFWFDSKKHNQLGNKNSKKNKLIKNYQILFNYISSIEHPDNITKNKNNDISIEYIVESAKNTYRNFADCFSIIDFVSSCYQLASEDLCPKNISISIITGMNISIYNNTSIFFNNTNLFKKNFRGWSNYKLMYSHKISYMDLIEHSKSEIQQFRMNPININEYEFVYPLETFLSIIDHRVMFTKKECNEQSINLILPSYKSTDKISNSKSKIIAPIKNNNKNNTRIGDYCFKKNVIESTPSPKIEGYDIINEKKINLPIHLKINRQTSKISEKITFENSFFLRIK